MDQPARETAHPAEAIPPRPWHSLESGAALEGLRTEPAGLSDEEAAHRLQTHGPNCLPQKPRRSPPVRFLVQFHNLLIYVLLAAAVLAAAIGHGVDAVVIFAVVVINAAISFVQEGKAEKALDAIRRMIDPQASVIRAGRRLTTAAETVVPGDIVLLEGGDRVPADLRLIRARHLRADEAILTGESVPVDKTTAPADDDAPLGDRFCMAFSGTFITAGQGTGVAVSTGAATELGRISVMIGAVERLTTPLIRQMDRFARQVTAAVLAASAAIFAYAVLAQSYPLAEAFMAVVGLAVAAIPEGLPAVMTITLAVGVQRMARRNAIIRRLPAVETLGSVSVICSDKTGTLTRNEMTARSVATLERRIEVEGAGYKPEGRFLAEGAAIDPATDPLLEELALAALLCNDAHIRQAGEDWIIDGDPMEGALVSLAIKAGHDIAAARARFVRLEELPFDARHRYMATLNRRSGRPPVAYVKGAPEQVVGMCSHVADIDGSRPIDPQAGLILG